MQNKEQRRDMKQEKKHSIWLFVQGLLAGIFCVGAGLYILSLTGGVVISASSTTPVINLLHWSYQNLGISLVFFAIVLFLYVGYLIRLNKLLLADIQDHEAINSAEDKIDLLINIFFAIGVIWTAIGMRNALLASLGNMDAQMAAQKGAFDILRKLVDGGILLALSTTIFGGIGGYAMRAVKSWVVGGKLFQYCELRYLKERDEINDRLDKIATLLEAR